MVCELQLIETHVLKNDKTQSSNRDFSPEKGFIFRGDRYLPQRSLNDFMRSVVLLLGGMDELSIHRTRQASP